ncbi:MAG: PTS sugar transporter subunit IIC/EAL domain-containing protein [Schwartzia sp.]|nr:PTS sugar transporter subunit IIC/EAL domain-containing protein [Schwartzia sp. (in: firmicutes)]
MQSFKTFLLDITAYVEENHTARAVRRAFLLLTPFIVFFSFLRALLYFPLSAFRAFWESPSVVPLFGGLVALDGIYGDFFAYMVVIAVAGCLAREWELPAYQAIILPILDCICFQIVYVGIGNTDSHAYVQAGFLTALVVSVGISHLYYFLLEKLGLVRGQGDALFRPTAHNIAFSVLPVTLLVLGCVLVRQFLPDGLGPKGFETELRQWAAGFLFQFQDHSLLLHSVFRAFTQLLWFFGINGSYIVQSVLGATMATLLDENMIASITDGTPMNIITPPFNTAYMRVGGAGASLALLLAIFLRSQNKNIRAVGKIAMLPVCVNINEILLFGIPVVCNPVFFVPFLLAPFANLQIAYWATHFGLVPVTIREVSWNLPVFFSGYAAGGWNGVLLQTLLLLLDVAIYLPFVSMYDAARRQRFSVLVRRLEARCRECEDALRPFDIHELKDEERLAAMSLVRDLRAAIQKRELCMAYQPQYSVAGAFVGGEALLRWNHPEAGFIYPPLIIALAKNGKNLPDLERFIFFSVGESIAVLKKENLPPVKISLNITGDSLQYAELEDSIEAAMDAFGVKPEEVWIELTEQDAVASTSEAAEKLVRLKAKGHRLLIDDFGMGHTSIAYLNTNLFDVVKLDGAITRDVLENVNSQKIIASLVSLSRTMNLTVVAEFVDNVPQRDKLAELGCDIFQGYLYSRPVDFETFLGMAKGSAGKQ